MRKRFIVANQSTEQSAEQWLDLANLAAVEVTSESASHPIESALLHNGRGGWRANPGKIQYPISCARNLR